MELYDFINYELLRAPHAPYKRLTDKILAIDRDYFAEIDCDTEVLSPQLTPQLRDRIIADFKENIAAELNAGFEDALIATLRGKSGSSDEALRTLGEQMAAGMLLPSMNFASADTDAQVDDLYRDALRRTLRERVAHDNRSDIIAFRQSLLSNTAWHLQTILDRTFSDLISRLSGRLSAL